jgi:hypothetical protein
MASNLSVILSGPSMQIVNTTDSTTRANAPLNSPTLPAAEATFIDFLPIAAGAGTILTLPAATIWVFGVQNLGGVNGSPAGNITIQIQVTGGALQTAVNSPVIAPLGVYLFWNQVETANGIIAVTLVASVANTPVQLMMAA